MTFFRFAPLSRPLASTCIKCFALLAIVFVETDIVRAIDVSIGAPQVIYTKKQRSSGGGKSWPDGNLGVVSNGDGTYDFYAANSSKPLMTTGTLTNPGGSKQKVSIVDIPKKAFDYVAGGPVYADPYSGARLMVYHAEVQGKSSKNFYSVLGLALSTDPSGQTFHDLGTIITPNSPGNGTDVGGGSFAIVNGYFNVYYKDWLPNGHTSEVAVARAPLLDLLNNSLAGRSTSFTKYYNGGWTQPGLGGLSSHLELPNTANAWLGVSYNDYLGQLVMVGSQWTADGGDLYMTTSSDGVNSAPRQPVAVDPGEQFYPTIIGTGADPMHSGQSFYVYYTDSQKGAWSRWKDAELRRREITINSPSGIGSLSSSPTLTADWVELGGYQSDFQGGIRRRVGRTHGTRRERLANPRLTFPCYGASRNKPTTPRVAQRRSRIRKATTTITCRSRPMAATRAIRSICQWPAIRFRRKMAQASIALRTVQSKKTMTP